MKNSATAPMPHCHDHDHDDDQQHGGQSVRFTHTHTCRGSDAKPVAVRSVKAPQITSCVAYVTPKARPGPALASAPRGPPASLPRRGKAAKIIAVGQWRSSCLRAGLKLVGGRERD